MMVLFIMPCADMYEKDLPHAHDHSTEITHQNSNDHPETTDMCSPFCLCSCCGKVSGMVFQWNANNFSEIVTVELPKPNPQYIQLFIPHYVGEIWQPPQINV